MKEALIIHYFSDILCVWAWISQQRINELNSKMGDKIQIKYHYIDVFGDALGKIHSQWINRGTFDGFSNHVITHANSYTNEITHPDIWKTVRPASSANAHLMLKAIEIAFDTQTSIAMAVEFRKAFFLQAINISVLDELYDLTKQNGLSTERLSNTISQGTAMASLMNDYQLAKNEIIKGSPSFSIDDGRLTLYGNVGYRVLQANIEEVLNRDKGSASWC